jgi:hypothetical protein
MLDNPFPNVRYWKFIMIYMLFVVALKFLYQLPIFCATPAYTLYINNECSFSAVSPDVLLLRIDYLIGIHKYAGGSSYPKNEGIFWGLFPDIVVIVALLLHKNYLYSIGVWHYIRTKNNIYQNPSFKCSLGEMPEIERLQ